MLVLSIKKKYSSFLKSAFLFEKTCFKVKALKKFKISSDCHLKACRSLKQGAILKIPSSYCFLEEPMLFSVGLKIKLTP